MVSASIRPSKPPGLYESMVFCQYKPLSVPVNTVSEIYDKCYPICGSIAGLPALRHTSSPFYVKLFGCFCQLCALNNQFAVLMLAHRCAGAVAPML